MATRMQQRRGTASQWSGADPILAAGEFGFESDTNKFKIGDGINHWSDLDYFIDANSLANPSIGGAIVFEGATNDSNEMVLSAGDPTLDRVITLPDANGTVITTGNLSAITSVGELTGLTISGDLVVNGTTTTINSTAVNVNNQIVFEGTTADGFETTLMVVDPTADRQITFPDATDVVTLNQEAQVLSNKTLNSPKINEDVQITATSTELNILDGATISTAELNILEGAVISGEELNYLYGVTSGVQPQLDSKQDVISGVSDTEIGYLSAVTSDIQAQLDAKQAVVTGVSDTEIGYLNGVTSGIQSQIDSKQGTVSGVSDTEIGYLNGVTSGIQSQLNDKQDKVANVSDIEIGHLNGVTSDIQTQLDDKLSTATAASTYQPLVSGVSDSEIGYLSAVTSDIQAQLDAKQAVVSGVSDTEIGHLNGVTSAIQTQLDGKQATVSGVSDVEIGYLDGVTSAIQTQIDAKLATSTASSTYAPLADPTFTGTVSGITKSMVGLGNVDNTTDANKPVSTATQTALDLKAPIAAPTFTGTLTAADVTVTGNLTVSGTTTTVDTQDLVVTDPMIYIGEGNSANLVDLGLVSSFNDGTYQHAGIVRDASAGKWKIFKGVTDEPTTTINFAQGSLDALAVGDLEATTVTPSSGIVFTDGTQTKEGVVSRTPIIQKTDSYTLSALTERDSLIEVAKASATTITIPLNSAVAYPVGTSIDILQTSTGQVTIAGAAGVTVNATPGLKLRAQWSSCTLFKRATDTWIVMGDLSA